jgi:glycosyltransferase involved in cell wall biosynthesis
MICRPSGPSPTFSYNSLLRHADASAAVSKLILAGAPDSGFLDRIRTQTPAVFQKVKLLGPVSEQDKEEFFRTIDIFAYDTRYDGFGIPPLEAMLRRIPAVVSDIPVMREVLGPCALYLNKRAENPLSAAIALLEAMDDVHFEAFLDAAEKHAQTLSWDKYSSGLAHLLKST